ncbi:oligosaccharide flippase family protein [Variovorax paradoxus]|uniref:oligosaccharide flippase family protein n=1 Tax=Variovorax paradoxus TaxID=34073 RepID=UPI003D65B21C
MKRIFGLAAITGISAIASRGTLFVGALIYARYLNPADFGSYSLIQTTALLFTTFFALNLGQMATKLVAENMAGEKKKLGGAITISYSVGLGFSIVLGVLLVTVSFPLAKHVIGNEAQWTMVAASALLVFTGTLTSIQNGVALGMQKVKAQALINIVTAPFLVALFFFSARFERVDYALYSYIAAQVLICTGQQIFLSMSMKELGVRLSIKEVAKSDWKIVKTYGLPSSIAGLLTLPSQWIAMVFLARMESGPSELGIFSYANQFRAIAMFAIGILANATLPHLTLLYKEKRNQDYQSQMNNALLVGVLLVMMMGVFMYPLSPYLIEILAPRYAAAHLPLVVLIFSCVPVVVTAVYMRSSSARGNASEMVKTNAVFSIVLIVLAYSLRSMGALGISIAFLVAATFQAFAAYFFETKKIKAYFLGAV